tara:strand:- start:26876 stop:27247 length:372 start_codon:yes stop_codon:yes gene_type:complete
MQEDKDSLSQEKRGAGQPPHQPTEEQIEQVKAFVKVGVMGKVIADYLGISEPTFYKHYRKHIDEARCMAHARVGKSLYEKAVSGDTSAMIWYSKAQMRWAEKKEIAHSADSSNFKVVFQESDE